MRMSVVLMLVACDSGWFSIQEEAPSVDTLPAEPDAPSEPPGPAPCDLQGLTPGEDVRVTMPWDGIERAYWLHVPADYDCTPRPLFIGLHYFSGEAHAFETDVLKIHADLNQRGWFGLFPQALAEAPDGTWTAFNDLSSHNDTGPDGPTCTDWAYEQPTFDTCPDEVDRRCHWGTSCADDVGWTRALIGDLSEQWSIDPDRIFLTGFSQGAIAAQGWACPLGDLLAAVAPMHGFSANGYGCGPDSGVSLMQIYGYWDIFVNGYDQPSADGLIYESAEETADAWATAQGCDNNGDTRYRTVSDGIWGWGCTEHADCATGASVVSCEWDGTHILGRDPANGDFMLNAVWEFFESHPRR